MAVYYNEIDHSAAMWLRELIAMGLIAPGDVDERSIDDVIPTDLMGYDQCHFFAGIGVWSYALRQAGWPDYRPVWTGSCPCQPFSAAGKGGGTADERHLWPAFEWLICQFRPECVIGEQVEAAIKHDWLDHVGLSLEALGYAVGAVGFPACSVGAPHIRQRLYWVAHTSRNGRADGKKDKRSRDEVHGAGTEVVRVGNSVPTGLVADAEGRGQRECGHEAQLLQGLHADGHGVLGNSDEQGSQGQFKRRNSTRELPVGKTGVAGPTNGFWSDAEWIPCRDGKQRPTESGTFPLVDGSAAGMVHRSDPCSQEDEIDPQNTAEARVMRLKGYGNAIVAPVAIEFVKAVMVARRVTK